MIRLAQKHNRLYYRSSLECRYLHLFLFKIKIIIWLSIIKFLHKNKEATFKSCLFFFSSRIIIWQDVSLIIKSGELNLLHLLLQVFLLSMPAQYRFQCHGRKWASPHAPVSRTLTIPVASSISTTSTSPPSAWRDGRILFKTTSTFSFKRYNSLRLHLI